MSSKLQIRHIQIKNLSIIFTSALKKNKHISRELSPSHETTAYTDKMAAKDTYTANVYQRHNKNEFLLKI